MCAWDGTFLETPDTAGNSAQFGKPGGRYGPGGYPLVRVLVLVACGSRALLDAVFDAKSVGESTLAVRLLPALRAGMLLLADRNFTSYALWCQAHGTGADLLWRIKKDVHLHTLRVLPDGSVLARWNVSSRLSLAERERLHLPTAVLVRVIYGWVTVIDQDGVRRSEPYRLATTLTDPAAYPAAEIVPLYARRWQVELMIKGLKCVQGAAHLRSKTPAGIRQEVWAWLCTHQLLRLEAARAADDAAGPAPAHVRQINFTTLLQRLTDAVILTSRRYPAHQALTELREATREDITALDIRIRIYDRVVKHPHGPWPGKQPRHKGRTATYEYTIDPAPDHTTDNQPATPQPAKINS